ncbi:HAD-like domain-containing protein [Mrakia frigida]|uniref:HAD-like domain-containing protein n=1 Tax=Mrakia frigida TaxID=29902 RepID=UPI003FCC2374
MSSSTALPPPPTLPFPIVVQQLKIQAGNEIKRGDILLQYSFEAKDPDDRHRIQKRVGSWECPIEGKLTRWNVKVGEVVIDSRKPLLHILEPCTHAVQLEGLCALCGKDLTTSDYLGPSQASRASIRMSHDTTSVLVSLEEASRLDNISTSHLLSTRRLSLIVDLDQTIIHATVDPTVGEWMDECGLLPTSESKGKGKDSNKKGGKGRRRNPNEEALRDVGRFKLGLSAGRVEDDCWYYIKPRPGLPAFLKELSKLYEMHVYTMGTRAYAEKVCEVIDPKGEFFGRRILSRDESGSLTAKSIARLFPVDTSMVVIIDDRSDVWEGSRNLVKVVPCEFHLA